MKCKPRHVLREASVVHPPHAVIHRLHHSRVDGLWLVPQLRDGFVAIAELGLPPPLTGLELSIQHAASFGEIFDEGLAAILAQQRAALRHQGPVQESPVAPPGNPHDNA